MFIIMWKCTVQSPLIGKLLPLFLLVFMFGQLAAATTFVIWRPPCTEYCAFVSTYDEHSLSLNLHPGHDESLSISEFNAIEEL